MVCLPNIGTVCVGAVLLALVVFIVCLMYNDKKKGKSSCGCSCSGSCAHCRSGGDFPCIK